MRYWIGTAIAMLAAVFLDTFVFSRVSVLGVTPDCVLVLVVSMGILKGPTGAAAAGCAVGLFMDILCGRAIGINAIAYMLSGVIGGIFYKKYYADNLIIPVATTAVCAFMKENIMALITSMVGGSFAYFEMLLTYMIPSAAFSALLCLPVHSLMKPGMARWGKKRYDRAAGGSR